VKRRQDRKEVDEWHIKGKERGKDVEQEGQCENNRMGEKLGSD
jgi:hypothetical protein